MILSPWEPTLKLPACISLFVLCPVFVFGDSASIMNWVRLKETGWRYCIYLNAHYQARLKRVKTGPAVSGLASSIAFTPVQGMELVAAPVRAQSKPKAGGYFGDSGFVNVRK